MSNEEKNQSFEEPQHTENDEHQEEVWEEQQPCWENIGEAETTDNPEGIEPVESESRIN